MYSSVILKHSSSPIYLLNGIRLPLCSSQTGPVLGSEHPFNFSAFLRLYLNPQCNVFHSTSTHLLRLGLYPLYFVYNLYPWTIELMSKEPVLCPESSTGLHHSNIWFLFSGSLLSSRKLCGHTIPPGRGREKW